MSTYELEGWPHESYTVNGYFVPERKVICAWSNRFIEAGALDDLEYAYRPGCRAFPTNMAIEPFGAQTGITNGLATYEKALITVNYSSELNTNAALVEWLEPSNGMETCEARGAYWFDNSPIGQTARSYILQGGCVLHRVRRKCAVVPASILTQINYVNASAMTTEVLNITFSAQTLRACVPYITRTMTVSGLTSFTVHQMFQFKGNGGLGWNAAYQQDSGAFGYIYDLNGSRIYDYPVTNFVLI